MTFLKKNLNYVVLFFMLVVLMAVGTFLDLPFSQAVAELEPGKYYSKNVFAVFFECFGETPIYILPSLALGVLFFYIKSNQKLKKSAKIILAVLCFCCALGLNYYGSHKLLKYYNLHVATVTMSGFLKIACEAGLGVAFTVLWFFIASFVKPKYLKSLAICSLIVVLTAIFSQVTTQALKPFFGRARYRLMNVTGDFSEFTRWYEINVGKKVSAEQLLAGVEKDGYKSFPSGHTTAAAIVFSIMSLASVFVIDKRRETLIFIATCLYVFVVAYFRIIMGAHYLTDVAMGAIIGLLSFLLARLIVLKVLKKNKGGNSRLLKKLYKQNQSVQNKKN